MTSNARSLLAEVKQMIPPLSEKLHKGQAGRVGIVGGSRNYTGAPYFASMSCMRFGADMSYTICDPEAGNALKTYSPDLIVNPILGESRPIADVRKDLEGLFGRLHSIVVGPGLGRDEHMQKCGRVALELARQNDIWTVVDADGLWLVANDPSIVKGWNRVVLTPNVVEFGRLCNAMKVDTQQNPDQAAKLLAQALDGPVIIEKGKEDRVTNGKEVLICSSQGSLKRAGGQGDILAGTLSCLLAWAKIFHSGDAVHAGAPTPDTIPEERLLLLAAYGAAETARRCSFEAFKKHGRALLADDLLPEVGKAYKELFGDPVKEAL
ncbi:unnamed protein product [Parajaminaea phylloscopi]